MNQRPEIMIDDSSTLFYNLVRIGCISIPDWRYIHFCCHSLGNIQYCKEQCSNSTRNGSWWYWQSKQRILKLLKSDRYISIVNGPLISYRQYHMTHISHIILQYHMDHIIWTISYGNIIWSISYG